MHLKGNRWYFNFQIGGVRYQGSTGFLKHEKEKARDAEELMKVQVREKNSVKIIWHQLKRHMIKEIKLPLTFDALWDVYRQLNPNISACKEKSQLNVSCRIRDFCHWMHLHHPEVKNASEMLHRHAAEWSVFLCSSPGSPYTKAKSIMIMRKIFSVGEDYGIIENPFDGIQLPKKTQIDREIFTPEELALIGKHAKGWIYSLCLTAISTGLREGDICMLKKSHVNLETNWISIPRSRKTGAPLEIPLLSGLRNHLVEMFKQYPDSEYVYPELQKKYSSKMSYQMGVEVKKFFNEIGIKNTLKTVPGYKRRMSVKDVHSFRHTFVYLAAVNNIPFTIIQGIVGHKNPNMTRLYMNHADNAAKRRFFELLPEYLVAPPDEIKISHRPDSETDRIIRLLEHLTPQNAEKFKRRIISRLRKQMEKE